MNRRTFFAGVLGLFGLPYAAPRAAADQLVVYAPNRAFVSKVKRMLRRRHPDPACWQVLPFPVVYRGEVTRLVPRPGFNPPVDA